MANLPAGWVRWFLVFWLFILGAVTFLDLVNISIAGGATSEANERGNRRIESGFVLSTKGDKESI